MGDTQAIGSLIGTWRKSRHLSIPAFCELLGISKSTYNRIVNHDGDLRLNQFTGALEALQLSLTDIEAPLRKAYLPLASAYLEMNDMVDQISAKYYQTQTVDETAPLALAKKDDALSVKTGNDGYHLLSLYLQALVAELKQNGPKLQAIVDDIYQLLIGYERWSRFELQIIVAAAGFFPYARFKLLFTKLMHSQSSEPSSTLSSGMLPFLYRQMLGSAVATGKSANVVDALHFMQKAEVDRGDYLTMALQRFIQPTVHLLLGQEALAQKELKTLQEAALTLTGLQNHPLVYLLTGTWGDLLQAKEPLQQTAKQLDPAVFQALLKPQQRQAALQLPPLESRQNQPISSELGDLRAAKRIKVDKLIAALNISPATYNRIISGETDVRMPVFFGMMDQLHLDAGEINTRLMNEGILPLQAETQHSQALIFATFLGTNDKSRLQQFSKESAQRLTQQVKTSSNRGFEELLALDQMSSAYLDSDLQTVKTQACALTKAVSNGQRWSTLDLTVLAACAEFTDVDGSVKILQQANETNTKEAALTNVPQTRALDLLYTTTLLNALNCKNRAALKKVDALIQKRLIQNTNVQFRLIKQFAVLADLYLAGSKAEAKKQFDQLQAANQTICGAGEALMDPLLTRLWQKLDGID